MSFFSFFKFALSSLHRFRRRSFFTMLGIMIGVVAVVLVFSVGSGVQGIIVNQIRERGTDLLAVLPGASEASGPPAQALGIAVTTLTYEDGLALLDKKNVSHIRFMAGYLSGNDVLQYKNVEKMIIYTGTTASYKDIENAVVAKGRFLDEKDYINQANVLVLGDKIADEIFGNQSPVGEAVKLKGKLFRVVGVLAPQDESIFNEPNSAVLVPLSVVQKELLGVRHVSFLHLKIEDEKYLGETIEAIRATLKERHTDEDFSIRNIADALAILKSITSALKFFLVAIAAVSLFVGGVGIMNIMLISVKEKTREIGLRKSLGARNQDIIYQFLTESIVLTTLGGGIGLIIGLILSWLVAVVVQSLGYNYPWSITPAAIFLSLGTASLIGLVFGYVPAQRAARLNPIQALRYE